MKLRYLLTCIMALEACIHAVPPTPDPILPIIRPRSQELNRPLQLVGECEVTHKIDKGPFYATLSAAGFYNKTFKNEKITTALFGKSLQCSTGSCNPYLHIQGSSYLGTARDPKALLADYFYLPLDYDGTVFFAPHIENGGADIDLYFGLNNIHEGAYLRIHSSIVNSRWDLGIRENITTPGILGYPDGYFTPNFLTSSQLLSRFTQYGCGQAPLCGVVAQDLSLINNMGVGAQDMAGIITTLLDPLAFAKICCQQSKTALADIRFELGRILKESDDYHIGADLQVVAPTGTKINSRYLFEPTIGNGHHWELGGGVHAHYRFYKNDSKEAEAAFYGDFTLTHLFGTHQKRTFDLKDKPLSRYMLATTFPAGSVRYGYLYPNPQLITEEIAPVANISTLDVSVSVPIQVDFTALFHYHKKKWDFDLGYNLWYRSRENIRPITGCQNSLCNGTQYQRWGLKGDARVYGFFFSEDDAAWVATYPLVVSESQATIYQGTNQVLVSCSSEAGNDMNINIDNPLNTVQSISGPSFYDIFPCPTNYYSSNRINISDPPVLLSCCDLDIKGIKSFSNKIFANSSYSWEWNDRNPFIGLGGSAEFGAVNLWSAFFAPSSWEVWVKAGISFS